jgi:hypothetical protein
MVEHRAIRCTSLCIGALCGALLGCSEGARRFDVIPPRKDTP